MSDNGGLSLDDKNSMDDKNNTADNGGLSLDEVDVAVEEESSHVFPSDMTTVKILERCQVRLKALWPAFLVDPTSEKGKEICDEVNEIPYFPSELKNTVQEALENVIVAHSALQSIAVPAEQVLEGDINVAPVSPVRSPSNLQDKISADDRQLVEMIPTEESQLKFAAGLAANVAELPAKHAAHAAELPAKDAAHAAEIAAKDAEIAAKDAEIAAHAAEMAAKVAEIAAIVAAHEAEVAAKVAAHAAVAAISVTSELHTSIQHVDKLLNGLARMSQAERTILGKETRIMAKEEVEKHYGRARLAGDAVEEMELFQQKKELDLSELLPGFPNSVSSPSKISSYSSLKKSATAWSDWITASQILKDSASDHAENLKDSASDHAEKTIQGIEWMVAAVDDNLPDSTPSFPCTQGKEVAGTQRAMLALVELIAECWKHSDRPANALSPMKTKVKSSEVVTSTLTRMRRSADLSIAKPGRFQVAMLDHALKLLIEVKSLTRKNQSQSSLHHESFEQAVGHLAKNVYSCLNLFGVGTDTVATGMTSTLAYITVYQLKLNMKTATESDCNVASLELFESKMLPLMTKKCFDKWTAGQDHPGLRERLYGGPNTGVDDGGVPLGIRCIWELMYQPRAVVFGPDYSRLLQKDIRGRVPAEYLGTGSFSVVMGIEGEADSILKVATLTSAVHLRNEACVLRALDRENAELDEWSLPVLKDETKLLLELGGIKRELPGLVLQPKGLPLLSYMRAVRDPGPVLEAVSTQIKNALDFIHERKVHHNDVSPKNMVIKECGGHIRIYLVDFGIASVAPAIQKGFIGTPLYTHREIFFKYPRSKWTPLNVYDIFSLGLTLAALLNGGEAAWDMDPFPISFSTKDIRAELESKVSERSQKAKNLIDASTYEGKSVWSDWILEEQDGTNSQDLSGKKRCRESDS